jgi:hypothetical protein
VRIPVETVSVDWIAVFLVWLQVEKVRLCV